MAFEIRCYPSGAQALAVRCDVCHKWIDLAEQAKKPHDWTQAGYIYADDKDLARPVFAHKAPCGQTLRHLPWAMSLDVELLWCLENLRPDMAKLRQISEDLRAL